jgi:hypothetical protein
MDNSSVVKLLVTTNVVPSSQKTEFFIAAAVETSNPT